MTLRDKIKKLCKETGIPITKLETDLGFAKGYISKLDKSTPNSAKLQKIADYFGVSLDYLMVGKENHSYIEDTMLYIRILKDTELEQAIKKYYTLDDRERKHIIELIELLSQKNR